MLFIGSSVQNYASGSGSGQEASFVIEFEQPEAKESNIENVPVKEEVNNAPNAITLQDPKIKEEKKEPKKESPKKETAEKKEKIAQQKLKEYKAKRAQKEQGGKGAVKGKGGGDNPQGEGKGPGTAKGKGFGEGKASDDAAIASAVYEIQTKIMQYWFPPEEFAARKDIVIEVEIHLDAAGNITSHTLLNAKNTEEYRAVAASVLRVLNDPRVVPLPIPKNKRFNNIILKFCPRDLM